MISRGERAGEMRKNLIVSSLQWFRGDRVMKPGMSPGLVLRNVPWDTPDFRLAKLRFGARTKYWET